MLSIRSRFALAAAVLLSFTVSASFGQTTLAYKFKKGDTFKYSLSTNQKQAAKVNGMDFNTAITQGMELTWTVKDVQNGKSDLVQKIDEFSQKMEVLGQTIEFDSKKKKKPEGPFGQLVGPLFEAMVGAEFTSKMDPQGETTETKISDKLAEAIKANPMLAQMGDMFSEEGMKNMMQQSGLPLPKEALSKGKTWNKAVQVKTPAGVMKIDTTYTYQGPETRNNAQLEKIDFKSAITMEPAADAKITVKVKSAEAKGTAYFDNKAGKLVETSQTQKLSMEVAAMGQTFDSNQEQTTTLKLVP